MKVTVNGQERVIGVRISYSQLIMLVYQNGSRPDKPTITYWTKGRHGQNPSGTLLPGDIIDTCPGMVFNVADTSNA
jgi:Multiubiquitin